MPQINAYINFNGKCREGMAFYKECLGGNLNLQSVAESPMADQWPAEFQQGILHGELKNGPLLLLGSDMPSPEGSQKGNHVSLSLTCSSAEEMNIFFSKLSAGGQATRPPHDFFAGMIAALTDKFGINWILYFEKN
ncbi:VOC family protein [Mucilaginibacter sp. HMF5004]|uniref:VOC family protein n=1 Tax=Mucilaginibacter rivuli TaxID=2857527 RepID=UPI001C5CC6A4|nr:VOC family protein [Mucilaginibacter rivuli]MBW4891795.1 VOC family protein [Mucilaginibacter rivuli]